MRNEMRKNCFSKKKCSEANTTIFLDTPLPPHGIFLSKNVENSIKREGNMK